MNSTRHQAHKETKLIILGAGCSLKSYPLAKDMLTHLKDFGTNLTDDASRLRTLVNKTVQLFEQLHARGTFARSLDDLALLVHNGHLADNKIGMNQSKNDRLVVEAKTAVAALFLSKEAEAMKDGLPGYRSLMNRIFSSQFGADCPTALIKTPYRVLTFNYDRLFELAFRQHFPYDGAEAFYGPTLLNSGLFQASPERVEVDPSRFSFLKLHGSVGFDSYENAGRCEHFQQIPDLIKPTPITDEEFFVPAGNGIHSNKAKPTLIVFPHEKDYLNQYTNNQFPYRFYIPEIWKAARKFAAQAKEIWLVGYSCPEPDFLAWSFLIATANNCSRVVVWNPSADAICNRLRLRLPQQAKLFEEANCSFDQFC